MIKALILLFASLTVASCGVKTTAQPELGDLTYTAYGSCYEGLTERSQPPSGGVANSGYFGKLINRSELKDLLPATIDQSARIASRERLALYVVTQGNSCTQFSFLKNPTTHIYEFWREASGGSGIGSLLGLYKEDCGSGCQPNRVINPLVMINACTDRWTLVHEMTHHNFNVQRKKFRPLDSDEVLIVSLTNELAVLNEVTNSYNSSPSEYSGMQLVHSLDNVRDLLVRFVYTTSFEEVSIESMLMREYASGYLSNVPADAVKNAISYIRYSIAAGLDRVAPIKQTAIELSQSAQSYGWSRVVSNASILKTKLETFEDDSNCYLNEATALYDQATLSGIFPGEEESGWFRLDPKIRNKAIQDHIDAHSKTQELKPLEDKLKNILSTIRR